MLAPRPSRPRDGDRHEGNAIADTPTRDFIEALGHHAIDKGRTVAWHTPETLAQLLRRHRVDDSVNKAIGKLIRVDLVVIDDVGLLPISTDAAEALFRVVDAAYEKRSIAISSNIHPSGFDELMPKSLATATVERLLHHAHVLITDGQDSYRLAQATAGKGSNHSPNTTNKQSCWWGDSWPPAGDGHQWGNSWPPVGRTRWPLTATLGPYIPTPGVFRTRLGLLGWALPVTGSVCHLASQAFAARYSRKRGNPDETDHHQSRLRDRQSSRGAAERRPPARRCEKARNWAQFCLRVTGPSSIRIRSRVWLAPRREMSGVALRRRESRD